MDHGHHNSNILNVKDLNDVFIYFVYNIAENPLVSKLYNATFLHVSNRHQSAVKRTEFSHNGFYCCIE